MTSLNGKKRPLVIIGRPTRVDAPDWRSYIDFAAALAGMWDETTYGDYAKVNYTTFWSSKAGVGTQYEATDKLVVVPSEWEIIESSLLSTTSIQFFIKVGDHTITPAEIWALAPKLTDWEWSDDPAHKNRIAVRVYAKAYKALNERQQMKVAIDRLKAAVNDIDFGDAVL